MTPHEKMLLSTFGRIALFMGVKWIIIIALTRYARKAVK